MLVQALRKDGCIRIGDDIFVRILKCSPSVIKVGIEAPTDVSLRRIDERPLPVETIAGVKPND